MHRYRGSLAAAAVVIAGALCAVTSASASPKAATLKYFFKSTGQSFLSPSGTPLSNSATPAAGDQFSATDDLYVGDRSHHAKTATASAVLNCVVTSVVLPPNTEILARCEGVIAIGGSLIYSISTQNFASSAASSVYPITGGAGIYLGAKGAVKTTTVGKTNNSNGVITIH